MPRDLGKAKRSDLTGHFPGERAEYGSSFARFLEGAGQLKPLQDGSYLDAPSGNGNGRSTEVPGGAGRNEHDHSVGGSTDTEIGHTPVPGNGASGTLFDTQGNGFFDDDAMFPEPALNEPDGLMQSLSPDADELEPVEFEPSADTLRPSNEPATLESVPDLISPDLDEPDDDSTEILDRNTYGMPTPASASDTGLLEPEEMERVAEEDRISLDDLSADDEETRNREPGYQEDRITSKVEPRRDVDPRSHDPNAVVRDTVNFYNQTQNFKEQKSKSGFPTISPNVVNSTQPLEISRERHDTRPLQRDPKNEPQLVENEPDLMPSAFADAPSLLSSTDEPDLNEGGVFEPMGAQTLSSADALMPEEGNSGPGSALEPMSLDVDTQGLDLDGSDRRETDKFREEDRQPPKLPLPEGSDKGRGAVEREADEELEPIADEKVAGGKDTQRFYVADILAKKPRLEEPNHTGDTTSELQPAEQGLPAHAGLSGETVADQTSEPTVDDRPTRIRTKDESIELPSPTEVNTDFRARSLPRASDRIVPELETEHEETADDTVDEEAVIGHEAEKITDKLEPPPERDRTTRRRSAARPPAQREPQPLTTHGNRVKHVTDALSKRLKQEREETLRLIEQAEAVAVRLRDASDASRADLAALSERRASARTSADTHVPEAPAEITEHAGHEEPIRDEFATAVMPQATVSARSETTVALPVSRRNANRVPTRAIGELVNDLKRAAVGTPSTLSELLAQVSHRVEAAAPEREEEDLDMLVAASARLRETLDTDAGPGHESLRIPVIEEDYDPPRHDPTKTEVPVSTLSSDLDRLWKVLDSRRTATVMLPPPDKARITREDAEVMEGWTQEMLWPTMAGIAVVTFILGALFVWVLSRM